ncbi:MAG TPA: DNA polymerase/3'-5' exonuclease PolX [bacterium]|jgi:DNA polymerase (family 10)
MKKDRLSRVGNAEIAEIFNTMAGLLDIEGANPFRIRAYRTAAYTVGNLAQNVSDLVKQNEDLSTLPGIGKDLAAKIEEIVNTGTLSKLQELEKETPQTLIELMRMPGLGPKRIKLLYHELGVKDLDTLKAALNSEQITTVSGFGEKTIQRLREQITQTQQWEQRVKISVADDVATRMVDYLRGANGVKECIAAGSYRRRKETVGDLDMLVTCTRHSDVMERFIRYGGVARVLSHGDTRSTVVLSSGFQVDVRVVPQASYGAALLYFTGSKPHNITLRKMALERHLKINEYGVFKGARSIAGRTEEEMYATLGLPYIEPELRENLGEIEVALQGELPDLVDLGDIRGELHAHTTESDGRSTLEEMAQAAKARGYKYLAISDHSQRLAMARGLDPKRLRVQMAAIDKLNAKLKGIVILKSSEVDILEDGSLDLPDEILARLDVVTCSVHSLFKLPLAKQTERIIRAMDNPYFNILGHPTGRLINQRPPYEVDMQKILLAARERGCFMEVNAHPDRLDLNDMHCRMAKDLGVKIAICTDAHTTQDLNLMRYGVWQARRGWLSADDVLNTRTWTQLKKLLKRK